MYKHLKIFKKINKILQVICIDPKTGQLIESIDMPVRNITSVCWGGENMDILYVVTATPGLTDEELRNKPNSGATFQITGLKTKGLVPSNFKINLKDLEL